MCVEWSEREITPDRILWPRHCARNLWAATPEVRISVDRGPSSAQQKQSPRWLTSWPRSSAPTTSDKGIEAYESRHRQQQVTWLVRQAAALNLQLIPSSEVTG